MGIFKGYAAGPIFLTAKDSIGKIDNIRICLQHTRQAVANGILIRYPIGAAVTEGSNLSVFIFSIKAGHDEIDIIAISKSFSSPTPAGRL